MCAFEEQLWSANGPTFERTNRSDDVAPDFERIPHATQPGLFGCGTSRDYVGDGLAKTSHPYGSSGPPHVLQNRQAGGLELRDCDFTHICFVPWTMTMAMLPATGLLDSWPNRRTAAGKIQVWARAIRPPQIAGAVGSWLKLVQEPGPVSQ